MKKTFSLDQKGHLQYNTIILFLFFMYISKGKHIFWFVTL